MQHPVVDRLRSGRMVSLMLAGIGLVGGGLAHTAQADAPARLTAAEASLLKAEDALFHADTTGDVEAIKRGFAEEAIFVHANGMIQTKADYLRATADAKTPAKSVSGENRVVRIFGNVGVVRGTKNLVLGNDMHLSGSYLTVYVRRDGRWQMLDSQSAPAPKPPGNDKPSETK